MMATGRSEPRSAQRSLTLRSFAQVPLAGPSVGTPVTKTKFSTAAKAWAAYDFAYSIFIFLFGVRYFPAWIVDDLHHPDWYIGVTQGSVVIVVLALMPLAGVIADMTGRRKALLAIFTIAACIACAGVSFTHSTSIIAVLALAGIATGFSQLAFAQFDPLLADVSDVYSRGRVSGLAVSLGFAGVISGLGVTAAVVAIAGHQAAFAAIAAQYAIFALPALFYISDRDRPRQRSLREVLGSLRSRGVRPHLPSEVVRFLIGRFLYSDAIVTMGAFLAVYMSRVGGFTETDKDIVIGIGVVSAALAAALTGPLVDRWGPRFPLLAVLPIFVAALLLIAVTGDAWAVWAAAPIAGGTLGVVWTADRVFMLRLTDIDNRGEAFGYFNLANRTASAFGPLVIWSATIWLLHNKTHTLSALGASRVAVTALGATVTVGWFCIRPLVDGAR